MLPALLLGATLVVADTLPTGQVIPEVTVTADPAETYALYLPKGYSPARAWPLILAFDPGGRGRTPVERYQAAAEMYGVIVAGSNNSRNYSRENDRAVVAMATDVLARFHVDERRVYTAGMSGGARVAMGTALASSGIAGVIASSAGFPDGTPRASVPFLVYGTAGTEDFNHLEMRRLDQKLTTPHHLAIFQGGHTWLSSDMAIEAWEWMEIQAVKAGTATKDQARVESIFAKRVAAADTIPANKDRYVALKSIADDFAGVRDVAGIRSRVDALGADPAVVAALRKDLADDNHETDVLLGIKTLEAKLTTTVEERGDALVELRRQWRDLSEAAKAPEDTAERRLARRVIGLLGATVTTKDSDYLKIIGQYRMGRGRQ